MTIFLKNLFKIEDGFILRSIDLTKEARNRIPIAGRPMPQRADSEVIELSMANHKYFHLCSRENSAILLEVKVDSSSTSAHGTHTHVQNSSTCIGRVNLTAFSLNLNLLDATEHESENFEVTTWLETENALKNEVSLLSSRLNNLSQFVAEFHLKIIYRVWADYYASDRLPKKPKKLRDGALFARVEIIISVFCLKFRL